jgi:AcrR family transcriptional regulator
MKDAVGPAHWVSAGLGKLAESGIEGVKVEVLARDLGVTKGSFYWHFADRGALLDAMLEAWERRGTLALIEAARASGAAPGDQLRAIAARAFAADVARERAVRAWATHDARAAEVLARVDRRRLGFIASRMRAHGLPAGQARARARLIYAAYVGEQQVAVSLPARRRVAMAMAALDVLLGPAPRSSR